MLSLGGAARRVARLEKTLAPASPAIADRSPFLIESFRTYHRAEQRDEILDVPADPQHPAEEAIDALRGAIRTVFPEGRIEPAQFWGRLPYAGGFV